MLSYHLYLRMSFQRVGPPINFQTSHFDSHKL